MAILNPVWLVLLLCCSSCQSPEKSAPGDPRDKVELDLTRLDATGLRGSGDGKVALSYEFAIPDTAEYRAEIRAIDPTVQLMPGSRGRIGAGPNECLCIGSTHQEDYEEVLRQLAERPYVKRIIECHFE